MNTSAIFHHPLQYGLHKRISLIRPPLIRSNSPTLKEENKKKSVRFHDNDSLEHVRLFLKSQMPIACRADPAECQKQWILDWISQRDSKDSTTVRLEEETMTLEETNETLLLKGTVAVINLAFEKHVQVVYTLDDWNTVHHVDASYLEPIAYPTWDRFAFEIPLVTCHQRICLAVKYTVNERDFWDNNHHRNYELEIVSEVVLEEEESPLITPSDTLHPICYFQTTTGNTYAYSFFVSKVIERHES